MRVKRGAHCLGLLLVLVFAGVAYPSSIHHQARMPERLEYRLDKRFETKWGAYRVLMEVWTFVPIRHRIKRFPDKGFGTTLIDGFSALGITTEMDPPNYISKFVVWRDGAQITIPRKLWRDCYRIWIPNDAPSAIWNKKRHRIEVTVNGGDGEIAYGLRWLIDRNGHVKRVPLPI